MASDNGIHAEVTLVKVVVADLAIYARHAVASRMLHAYECSPSV